MYISTEADLAAFCDRAAAFDAVAVDTEFLRERTYHPRLCLVQVATPEESVAIDPIALGDLAQQPHEQQRGAEKDDDQRVLPEKAQGAARDLAGPLGKLLAAGHV